MALQQINEGISGEQAANIIYQNDLENQTAATPEAGFESGNPNKSASVATARELAIRDTVTGLLVADEIKSFTGAWYFDDPSLDINKIYLGRREDIGAVRMARYDATLEKWVELPVERGTEIFLRTPNVNETRSFRVVDGGKVVEVFERNRFFTLTELTRRGILSTIHDISIEKVGVVNIEKLAVVRFVRSNTTMQIILNVNDARTTNNLPQQSAVFNIPWTVEQPYVSATNAAIGVTLVIKTESLLAFQGWDGQTSDPANWSYVSQSAVNAQRVPTSSLNTTPTFSPFFEDGFIKGVDRRFTAFIKDMFFIYPFSPETHRYFFRAIRKNYLNDGEASKQQILLFAQPLSDTGVTNAFTIASIIKADLPADGVETLELLPYSPALKSKFYMTVDWGALPATFNGSFTPSDNQLTSLAFNGGLGVIKATIRPKNFSELVASRLDTFVLGTTRFTKSTFNAETIDDYALSTDAAMPINTKLTGLEYVNLGNLLKFMGVCADNLYWFADASDNSVGYCSTLDQVRDLNITKVHTFANRPDLCRRLNSGELLVVTVGNWAEGKRAEIWVSRNGRTDWDLKMYFDNANNETHTINAWGFSQFGDRVVLAGYGKRYTANETPDQAPRYVDVNDKANYSIYYSPDSGVTWFNRLFNLGNMHPFTAANPQYKPYAHIHAVTIDPYAGELVITHGDLPVEADALGQQNRVFRSTNLRAWEAAQKNGAPITLTWTSDIAKKFGGVGVMEDAYVFGSDDVPNGIYVAPRIDKRAVKVELIYTDPQWSYQRASGNPGTTGEYGIWGGYTWYRRNARQPMYTTNLYVTGILPQDYKRCEVLATYNGYKYTKVWTSDYDLLTAANTVLPNTYLLVATDDYNNVLIQTRDSRFNPFSGGKPVATDDHTLVIARGI